MIGQLDAKSLEVVCAAWLSQDALLMKELTNKVDVHGANQKDLGLPEGVEGRLVAKIFVFRLIYGGSSYSYAHDPDFMWISKKEKYWQDKIDSFYQKYKGIAEWHRKILCDATRDKYLIMPTGRKYKFDFSKGIPQTTIKNYPVQGLGADIMAIIRVSFYKRFKHSGINGLLINTVHDSIVADIHKDGVTAFKELCHEVFKDLPANFNRVFNCEFNLPITCEVSVGNNMMEMEEI